MGGTPRPRVVLVEDDPSIRGFVAMALEDLDIDLVECGDVPAALAALRTAPAALVLTDLMLPGETGLSLARRLAADPALRGPARVAVFSAGLGADMREQLTALGVWRLLHKPVPLAELQACVQEALAGAPVAAVPPPPAAAAADGADRRTRAIAAHFGGDADLYDQFAASCAQRFGADIDDLDRACADADLGAQRRALHSLKSVLLLLGHDEASALARQGETLAAAGQAADAVWRELRPALQTLAR